MPPVWTSYVSVDDIDATVAKAEPAGGTVMQPPMDIMEAGRMAVVADPAGAVICMWEARVHIGAEVVNEPGRQLERAAHPRSGGGGAVLRRGVRLDSTDRADARRSLHRVQGAGGQP